MSDLLAGTFSALGSLLPGVRGVAILSADYSTLDHHGDAPDAGVLDAIRQAGAPKSDQVLTATTAAGADCHGFWISDPIDHERRMALLMLAGATPETADVQQVLQHLAQSWCREQALNHELDAMAEELANRYEELNLAYGSDNQIDEYEEGQAATRNLVRDCADYLDVPLSALLIPRKKVSIVFPPDNGQLTQREDILYSLFAATLPWLQSQKCSITLNTLEDEYRMEALPGMNHKIIACPLYTDKGEVEGLLAAVAPADAPDFTNSDRNLLEVMTRKAAKIVASNYDSLTGLFNRQALEYFIDLALRSANDKGITHCLLNINLNRIRIINDTISHEHGDKVICDAANKILADIRDSDVLARLEGGQFGLLLENCPPERGTSIAEKINQSLNEIVIKDDANVFELTACTGILRLDATVDNSGTALRNVELASNAAKERGEGSVQVFARGDLELVRRHEQMRWVAGIQTALREDRLTLYSQRIEPLQEGDGAPLHFEILMRMHDTDGNIVSPGEFLPAAERYNMMPAIDRWVVANTLEKLSEVAGSFDDREVTWAINLSGQSLSAPNFLDFLVTTVKQCKLPTRQIGFEVTETVAIDDLSGAVRFINTIRALGCAFSLDDFGTGLSSFTYLKALPLDYLKIDGSFVKDILEDRIAHVMVESIHDVGHAMGLHTIAEYVETEEIKESLRQMGVTYAQGYCVAKPRPLGEELDDLLAGRI